MCKILTCSVVVSFLTNSHFQGIPSKSTCSGVVSSLTETCTNHFWLLRINKAHIYFDIEENTDDENVKAAGRIKKAGVRWVFWSSSWSNKKRWGCVRQGDGSYTFRELYCHTRPILKFQLSWKSEKPQLARWVLKWHSYHKEPASRPASHPAFYLSCQNIKS